MASRVRHAQKIGASVPDLAAGIAYSVVKNALYRIIGADCVDTLGDKIVVQGGAFKSDAVLRAFEKTCGVEVTRLESAHLMGAIGSALFARERAREAAMGVDEANGVQSSLLTTEELMSFSVRRFSAHCPGCANNCSLSIADFGEGRHFVSGNRCEKANEYAYALNQPAIPYPGQENGECAGNSGNGNRAPNAIASEQRILRRFGDARVRGARGKRAIGLMNCFEAYEYIPFWHALFSRLGFSVIVPDDARGEKYEQEALATVPAESVCFPAKMSHMRLFDLLHSGVDVVFMPHFSRFGRCAVSCEYALALAYSVPHFSEGKAKLCTPLLRSFRMHRIEDDPDDVETLYRAISELCPNEAPLEKGEFENALNYGIRVQEGVFSQIKDANDEVISWLSSDERRHAMVIAGRPYHNDPRLMRGVDRMLSRLGFGVLNPTGLGKRAKQTSGDDACPSWKPGRHLSRLARFAAGNEHIDLICLQSFGCGYDALSLEDARDVLEGTGKPFTTLKIDDLSDKAHILIRLRTLAESIEINERKTREAQCGKEGSTARRPACSPHGGINAAFLHRSNPFTTCDFSKPQYAGTRSSCVGKPSINNSDVWIMAEPMSEEDVETARREIPGDVCFTAASLMARALRVVRESPQAKRLHIPLVCNQCLLEGLEHVLWRLCGRHIEISWENTWNDKIDEDRILCMPPTGSTQERILRVGLIGNPLLCYDAFMNDGIVELLRSLDCSVAMPKEDNLFVEDVSYLGQLNEFASIGVDCVIYLQSFGCTKAHIHARGFLHELGRRYPNMPVTVVDYDPESSALNRENRIRLAVEAAKKRKDSKKARVPRCRSITRASTSIEDPQETSGRQKEKSAFPQEVNHT